MNFEKISGNKIECVGVSHARMNAALANNSERFFATELCPMVIDRTLKDVIFAWHQTLIANVRVTANVLANGSLVMSLKFYFHVVKCVYFKATFLFHQDHGARALAIVSTRRDREQLFVSRMMDLLKRASVIWKSSRPHLKIVRLTKWRIAYPSGISLNGQRYKHKYFIY